VEGNVLNQKLQWRIYETHDRTQNASEPSLRGNAYGTAANSLWVMPGSWSRDCALVVAATGSQKITKMLSFGKNESRGHKPSLTLGGHRQIDVTYAFRQRSNAC